MASIKGVLVEVPKPFKLNIGESVKYKSLHEIKLNYKALANSTKTQIRFNTAFHKDTYVTIQARQVHPYYGELYRVNDYWVSIDVLHVSGLGSFSYPKRLTKILKDKL